LTGPSRITVSPHAGPLLAHSTCSASNVGTPTCAAS